MTIGTENVTNGNAAVATVTVGATTRTPIDCRWQSGFTDLGIDRMKSIKDVVVTAADGTLKVGVVPYGDALGTLDSKVFSDIDTLRYRGASTNKRARQVALALQNDTSSTTTAQFLPQIVTLRTLPPSNDAPTTRAEIS